MHPERKKYLGHEKLKKFTLPRLILYFEYRLNFTLEKLIEGNFLSQDRALVVAEWENDRINTSQEEVNSTILSYSRAIGLFIRLNHLSPPPTPNFEETLERYLQNSLRISLLRKANK